MLRIDKSVYLLAAVLILTLPLNWLMGAFFAAVFHELCHLLMIRFLGGQVVSIQIGTGGAEMEITPMTAGKELLCALAGPMGSLLLLSCCRWFPRMAICAGVQAVYNLLPVYPLDGGRILRCGLGMLFPGAQALCGYIEAAALWGIAVAAFFAAFFLHMGIFPLLLTAVLVLKKNSLQSGSTQGTIVLHHFKR